MRLRWRLLIPLAAIVLLITPHSTRAADERITNFTSDVTVEASGRVDVAETIMYDFGYGYRHGIYRYVPVVNKDNMGVVYKPKFTLDSVTVDGASVPVSKSSSNNNVVLKIGDPNRTITGVHSYVITYHYEALVVDAGGDLLRFNVTGNGWEVPIDQATLHLSSPTAPKVTCYTGPVGSYNKNCAISGTTVTTTNLAPGEGLTVEALWPSGTIQGLLLPYKTPLWKIVLFVAGIGYAATGIALMLAALLRWLGIRWAESRARRNQTIVAEYEPPEGLTPGELGLLIDSKTSLIEVTAMLIQAAVKGFLTITQIKPSSMFKQAEYTLTKKQDFAAAGKEEQRLLEALFGGKDELNLKDVDRRKVAEAVKNYQSALKNNLVDLGIYRKSTKWTTTGITAVLTVLFFFCFSPLIVITFLALVPLGIFLYKRAANTPRLSPEGLEIWRKLEGFKLFLSVTEKDRLAFTDAPKRTPKQFSAFLPYAIALGVEREWAKQFEGIDVAAATDWYYGYDGRGFTAGYLAANLHDSFSSTVASNATAPSTSSSSGFGGGFSGGGFSGGGGGSW